LGAFRPIYMAGFVQDKFAFKDLIFNIGVRVDRFDANQKVPKDIYSPLYGVKTASEVTEFGAHPTTVGDDYVVYVDSEEDPTAITGYRSGNQWYNKDGLAVEDPRVLQTGTQTIPYLIEGQLENGHKTPNYNTSLAFTDYNPQISVSPRVAFSFELSENAIFFAHYDVLAQRPQDRFIPTAKDYYFFEQTVGAGGVIDNPNLKPERTIDYQIGFKQKLSKTSALTISGFYRELKDMVQLYRVNNTYPVNGYNTYNNIDFGTVKGFDFNYDLRRTQNLRMTFNYTLQFADGTGSGDRSQANLIDFGRPNLRSIFPLSYDSRHLINVSADYGFGGGKDYNGPKL
ncbi:MAG TPA: TonB-dependent receptor, partial [Chitinophagales bacterium]|nr:TonB-dependent receptor [Chitinophagales bacterium]